MDIYDVIRMLRREQDDLLEQADELGRMILALSNTEEVRRRPIGPFDGMAKEIDKFFGGGDDNDDED